MEIQTQEARIVLAIEAIRISKNLGIKTAAKLYKVPKSTLTDRINGRTPRAESRPTNTNLTPIKEEVMIQYILDLDTRGFAPRLASVEDIANYMLEPRGGRRVGKL